MATAPAKAATTAADPATGVPVIEQTSLADRHSDPDEVTLEFTRWHAQGNTAYQRGEFAGFKRAVAQRLIAGGVAILASTPLQERAAAERTMVTK